MISDAQIAALLDRWVEFSDWNGTLRDACLDYLVRGTQPETWTLASLHASWRVAHPPQPDEVDLDALQTGGSHSIRYSGDAELGIEDLASLWAAILACEFGFGSMWADRGAAMQHTTRRTGLAAEVILDVCRWWRLMQEQRSRSEGRR